MDEDGLVGLCGVPMAYVACHLSTKRLPRPADFRCFDRYTKNSRYNPKNNPARSDGSRDSKVEKSKVALRRIFVFPLLLDTLPLSQCLRSTRNVTSASIRRAGPAAHRAKRLGFSTRWHMGGWRTQKVRLNTCIHTKLNDSHTRNAQGTLETQRRSRLGCTLANSAASTHGDAMRKATSRDFHFAPLVESGCDLG